MRQSAYNDFPFTLTGKGAKKPPTVAPSAKLGPAEEPSVPHVSIEMIPAGGSSSSSSDSASESTAPGTGAAADASTAATTSSTVTSNGAKNGGGGGHGSGGHEEQQASAFWLATCFTMLMGSGILFGMVGRRSGSVF